MQDKKKGFFAKKPDKPVMGSKSSAETKGGYLVKKTVVPKGQADDEELAGKLQKRVLGDNIGDNPEEALLDVNEKIASDKNNEELYVLKYQILKKLNASDELVDFLEDATDLFANPYFPMKLAEYWEEHFAYEKSLPWRRKASELKPNDVYCFKRLALNYVRVGDFVWAENIYEKICSLQPDSENPLGHTFFQEMQGPGLPKEKRKVLLSFGLKVADKALATHGDTAPLLEGIARLAKQDGQVGRAIAYYEKLLALPSLDFPISIMQWKTELLKLYAREGYSDNWSVLHKELLEDYITYLTDNENDSNIWLQLGLQQIQGGFFEEAIQSLKNCITLDPKNIQALYELGKIYIRLNRSDEAIEYYKQILPSEHEMSSRLKYHRALELCLADLYYRLGLYDEALSLYYREETSNCRYIAIVLEALGDSTAVNFYHKAIEISGRDARNFLAIAEYYVRKSMWEEAESAAREGLSSPHSTKDTTEQLYVVLATAMMRTNRLSGALQVMEDAIEKFPDLYSMELRRIKLLLMSGKADEGRRAGEELIVLIEKQLSCAPSASNLWTILGDLASLLSQFDKARTAYAEAMRYNALDADAVRGEGVLAEKFGEFEKAIELYSRYIMLEPLSLATPPLREKISVLTQRLE